MRARRGIGRKLAGRTLCAVGGPRQRQIQTRLAVQTVTPRRACRRARVHARTTGFAQQGGRPGKCADRTIHADAARNGGRVLPMGAAIASSREARGREHAGAAIHARLVGICSKFAGFAADTAVAPGLSRMTRTAFTARSQPYPGAELSVPARYTLVRRARGHPHKRAWTADRATNVCHIKAQLVGIHSQLADRAGGAAGAHRRCRRTRWAEVARS
jgi:hypothetical protein